MHAQLSITLRSAPDGIATASGDLAVTPFWCRWDGATLWLVSSAASPVGEDDITLDLFVEAGVHATVRSVAAMLVYAARGDGTRLTTRLHVAPEAVLVWQPEPVIVTARAQHRSFTIADVATGGGLLADELVVLGRSGEQPGQFLGVTDLRCNGQQVSLTSFDTDTPGWSGPGGTGGAKVVGTRVIVDPLRDADTTPTGVVDLHTVVLHPESNGALATTLAANPHRARAQLDAALTLEEGPSIPTPRASR